jgi:hypothetical protein
MSCTTGSFVEAAPGSKPGDLDGINKIYKMGEPRGEDGINKINMIF